MLHLVMSNSLEATNGMAPTFIELFAGIGGFRLGLERAGWKCLWANEFDKKACKIYRKNFGDKELNEGDIRNVETKNIPYSDMLVGGFPCQPFSTIGKCEGFQDIRGTLFFEVARIAKDKRPNILFLENVQGLLNHEEGKTFETIIKTLDELGYDVEWQLINSKYYGTIQARQRLFIIGHLRGKRSTPIFPISQNGKHFKMDDKTPEFWLHTITASYSNHDYGAGRPYLLFGNQMCCFTPRELERAQTFPDDWTDGVGINDRFKMIGNAVVVNVIQFLGERILASNGDKPSGGTS